MKIKAYDLRENRNIFSPIIFVPPDVQKHNIILPNEQLLIVNSEKNITGWINNGGNGLLFDENLTKNNKTRDKKSRVFIKEVKNMNDKITIKNYLNLLNKNIMLYVLI